MGQDKISITGKIYLVWEKLIYFIDNSKIKNEKDYEKEKQKLQYSHFLFKVSFTPQHPGVLGD